MKNGAGHVSGRTSLSGRSAAHAGIATAAVLCLLLGVISTADAAPIVRGHADASVTANPIATQLQALSHPRKKYFGMFLSRSPNRLEQVAQVTLEAGKEPNLSLFYQSWDASSEHGNVNFDLTGARQACANGMLPMMTWQSWDTATLDSSGKSAADQPAFSPRRITAGAFDPYIRSVATMVAGLGCPIAIRFDHEDNSSWYPWGLAAPGMKNTAAEYVAMWRHVWRIFHNVGATNVIWVWSPNVQYGHHPGLPGLRASYPGDKYVDWVGVDGYFVGKRGTSFNTLFGHTLRRLAVIAPHKPWIIGETGVGSVADKPALIKQLYASVASNPHLIGVDYFDLDKPGARSDWAFDETAASAAAFKQAVGSSVFGQGGPGSILNLLTG